MVWNAAACKLFRTSAGEPPVEKKPRTEVPESKKPLDKPKTKPDPVKDARTRKIDSLSKIFPPLIKDHYNVAVLLPLFLDKSDRLTTQQTSLTVSEDFYKGMLIAADTLKYCGMKLRFQVVDTENGRINSRNIADTFNKIQPDIVFGPLMDSKLYTVDSILSQRKITRISPIVISDKCLTNNYTFESLPSSEVTAKSTAEMLKKSYPGYKIILITENSLSDNKIAYAFKTEFNSNEVTHFSFSGKSASTYTPEYALGEKNIIFIPSKNEAFVSAIMAQLRLKEQEIILVGIYNWMYFRTIEGNLWEKLNVHLSTPFYIDYSDPEVFNFIKSYRHRFNQEPSIWAFIGFDEMTYYLLLMKGYGRNFQPWIEYENKKMLHSTYNIQYDSKCQSWRNTYINILKFEGFKLERVE